MWLVKICVVWASLTYITKDWLISLLVAIPLSTLDTIIETMITDLRQSQILRAIGEMLDNK